MCFLVTLPRHAKRPRTLHLNDPDVSSVTRDHPGRARPHEPLQPRVHAWCPCRFRPVTTPARMRSTIACQRKRGRSGTLERAFGQSCFRQRRARAQIYNGQVRRLAAHRVFETPQKVRYGSVRRRDHVSRVIACYTKRLLSRMASTPYLEIGQISLEYEQLYYSITTVYSAVIIVAVDIEYVEKGQSAKRCDLVKRRTSFRARQRVLRSMILDFAL